MEDGNDIKNLLIVDGGNYSSQMVEKFARRLIKFAKISKNGDIIILDGSLSPDDKLRIALVLRFIAHTFNDAIPETITLKELTNLLSERLEAVGSRLSKIIKNENFAKKISKGVYSVQYFVIDKFLTDLENKEHAEGGRSRKVAKNGLKRKDKAVTGVGKDILDLLISNSFFQTPKTIKEVCKKLEEETRFHNPKIVDMTVRKTFVNSKKILKRIPNPDKGKVKWLYVNR
ncbi:MAG: hypothetical protein Q8M92_09315 [Candidatus Subteraquimicrobiales bacterium]|nr:hypothetical protein [Candidatus Subteraquimicrobiales bacterium]